MLAVDFFEVDFFTNAKFMCFLNDCYL